MDIRKWIILLSFVALFLGLYSAANAEKVHAQVVNSVIVTLDQKTLVKGFSVKMQDGQFVVPIAPKQFKEKLTVKLSRVANTVDLPVGQQTISPFYEYDLRLKALNKPITVVFPMNDENIGLAKTIYYLELGQTEWLPLETKINYALSQVSAKISLPRAKVVVTRRGAEELTAQSAIVIDKTSGKVVFEKNSEDSRPIASLTKLMTTLVFLDTNPDFNQIVTMQKSDFVGGATLWVKVGDKVKLKDLFSAMLVGSLNNATMAVARSTGMTADEFVQRMNDKAVELGLKNTHFVEPTGLNEGNVSTAREMAVIAEQAFKNDLVHSASTTQWYKVVVGKASYLVKNTSFKLFQRDISIVGSKTGWTDEAGYNLVTQASNKVHDVVALVMGARIRMNYEEVYNLLKKYL